MAELTREVGEEVQRTVREVLTSSDELSRRAHLARHETMAQHFDALRTALKRLDVEIGGGGFVTPILARELLRIIGALEALDDAHVPPSIQAPFHELMFELRAIPKGIAKLRRDDALVGAIAGIFGAGLACFAIGVIGWARR